MKHEKFITDFGREIVAINTKDNTKIHVPRYGVWAFDFVKEKYQICDTGNNLEELKEKWDVITIIGIGRGA